MIALETCYLVMYTNSLVLLSVESVWTKGFLKYALALMVNAKCRAVLFVNVHCANVQNEATYSFARRSVKYIFTDHLCTLNIVSYFTHRRNVKL